MEKKLQSLLWSKTDLPYCGNITFHPSWWSRHCSLEFDEAFWKDSGYRLEADCKMRNYLYDCFGEYGMGEKNPPPRPILGTDLLASGFLFSAIAGCTILFGKENAPLVIPANLSKEQINALSVKKALSSSWWENLLDQKEKLIKEYGYVISCVNLQGVQNIALDLRGTELLMDYYEEPELAEELIAFCTELLLETGKELRTCSGSCSGGVTAISNQVFPEGYVHSNCTVEMISNDCYEEFLLPSEQKLSACFQPYGIHHCGQSMEHVCSGYSKVKGLSFAEAGAGSDLEKVRSILGDKVWLNMRYSPVRLMEAGKEELMEEMKDMVKKAGGKNRLSISCVGIDKAVSVEKCLSFLEATREVFFAPFRGSRV